ncbi:sporulation protein YqfD [Evansella sp. LMS18]|uniref:sporulation protein YqfD n=1 Tax=Evansella sp. LMS18 TaxID=2924033 RepID=UPI0020D134D4|nr:sporulation protein YqfD [Evansella sp. LMS18]UTR09356.1 sporulation protein YqfD [Evansella sp. LMS18]
MKNHWVHKLSGYVRIKISGPYPELFVNRCIDSDIQIWDIEHQGNQVLVCSVLLDEIPRLRKLARISDCKISFLDRKGLPFVMKRLWKRNGLLFGAAGALLLLYLLSNMVWEVEVEGATASLEHELRQTAAELGVKRGAFQFLLPAPEDLQSVLTDEIEDATWIGVTKRGTTYHFQIVQKEFAEREPEADAGNLVAVRKAVIHDIFVEEGKPLVEINQVVEKGDVLVSGLIGREGEEKEVAARGKVFGEIWYKAEVEVPLSRTLYTATGNKYRVHYLHAGDFNIPIWGWNSPEFENIKEESFKSSWSIFGFEIPVKYGYKDILETKEAEAEQAVDKAIDTAKEKGADAVLSKFSPEAVVKGEKVLHHLVENGKVKVIIHYRIVDEITVKQPIIKETKETETID